MRKILDNENFEKLNQHIIQCVRCPRLVKYIREVAAQKRRAYQDWDYWGKPVPNLGDPAARILIVGLAPGAHGANRTGRMFTGDESGNFLFRALYQAGLANQPTSEQINDGLTLKDVLITASLHCAPPGNRPDRSELANCHQWLAQTFQITSSWQVVIALGRLGFEQALVTLRELGYSAGIPLNRFTHGAEFDLGDGRWLLCSYHPSQQNTFTGKLTPEMLLSVLERAVQLAR